MAKAMAKTKEKAHPYQEHIDALRKKQSEILNAFKRDKQAVNMQSDDGIQDLADKAASAYSKELNLSLSDGERNLIVLIEESFTRLDGGTYGTCTNCGATIGDKRLAAVPWTPFCIDCQELQEKGLLS
jgi:DnaK suppressor protein